MEPLIIQGSDDTPEVTLDKQNSIFKLTGRSLPEDVISFYSPLYSWMEVYTTDPNESTTIKVKIDYFNSASQRAINEFLTIAARVIAKGKEIIIEWYYLEDDEEMLESGQEFEDIIGIPFNYISYLP